MDAVDEVPEIKPYTVLAHYHIFGRSQLRVRCPWCDAEFMVYAWSFAGSGKRCPGCGSKHGMYSGARRPPERKT